MCEVASFPLFLIHLNLPEKYILITSATSLLPSLPPKTINSLLLSLAPCPRRGGADEEAAVHDRAISLVPAEKLPLVLPSNSIGVKFQIYAFVHHCSELQWPLHVLYGPTAHCIAFMNERFNLCVFGARGL